MVGRGQGLGRSAAGRGAESVSRQIFFGVGDENEAWELFKY